MTRLKISMDGNNSRGIIVLKTARVNRPKNEKLCLQSERTTISEKVIWLNMRLHLLFKKNMIVL